MRFVHVADAHLDTSFAGRSEAVRRRLRDASREAFRMSVDLAIREDAHAFLIAGDLFDGDTLSFSTERFLLEEAHRLGDHGITVVYAAGNHDPGSLESGPRPLPWPPNVRVARDGTPQRIAVHDREGRTVGFVTAIGHGSPRVREDLSRRLPRPTGELPEVALLHTQVHASPGSEAHHAYAPSELTYLLRSGYDYWALGHVHTRQALSEDPPILYAGSLMGRTHTESGARGALLVDLSDRAAPSIAFRELAPVRWETVRVTELEEADSLDRLERRVALAWRAMREYDSVVGAPEWMVRVILSGPCPLWRELRAEDDRRVLARELREMLDCLDVTIVADAVHPPVPLEEHRARPDVLGEALRLLDAIRRGDARLETVGADALAGAPSEEPQGRMTVAGRADDLRNRPLPWTEHVPRGVFRQVFAPTLGELARLDGETWDRVQDRILGARGSTDLQPVRTVAADLEREAGELWRPTRRGNQRVRDLRRQTLALRERRRAASERDRRLRQVVAEAQSARVRLAEVRRERHETRSELDRLQELVPIRRQLQRISSLQSEAGDPAEMRGLPRDPLAELRRREETLDAETVDAVDGEAAALEQEAGRHIRERDRLWVLSAVLREADRRFREEHQRDLMRRAGAHLASLTAGRYDRILADDASAGDRFQITGRDLAGPIPLDPPVSTGTLEQAYLALRFAIVDHLDQGLERLPLFVDEVFVNSDRHRRLEGLEVLAGMARRRQLFLFTCHEHVAEELGRHGARVLRLGAAG